MNKCSSCKQKRSLRDFVTKIEPSGKVATKCKECWSKVVKIRPAHFNVIGEKTGGHW